jgi:hypothetical protein
MKHAPVYVKRSLRYEHTDRYWKEKAQEDDHEFR